MTLFDPQDPDFEARVSRSFGSLTLMQTVGARLLGVAPGEVEIDLPFREDLTQHHGFLAAAVVTAIVDVACGYAAMTLMPPGASVLTIEYKVNFLSPARGERMVARARVVRPGRSVTVCAGDVFAVTGGQEKLVAAMLATIIQVSGAGGAQSAAAETGQRVDRHQAGASQHGPTGSQPSRSWCICGRRGFREGLRDLVRFRRLGDRGVVERPGRACHSELSRKASRLRLAGGRYP